MRSNARRNERQCATVSGITERGAANSELPIVVLSAAPELTKNALRYAATLGEGLSVNLTLLEVEVVPFQCPLDCPPVQPGFARRRLESLAKDSGVSVRAEILYARDREEALTRRLIPGSIVLIPVKGIWGRICEKSLMRKLTRLGHDVALVPCK